MNEKKNIAVVGAGYWGKNLVRNFFELGHLKIICDSSSERQKDLREIYPDVDINGDFKEVLNDPEIQGVVLATPAETHFSLAQKALEHEKDVFVEKPLCLNPEGGRLLCEQAGQKNRILMVGHLLHYHPGVKIIKEMLYSGKLGKLHHIYSNRLNLGIFRTEENVMWSFAPHDISVILSMIESLPQRVLVTGTATLKPDLPDTVYIQMKFKNGLFGNIFVSWLHPFKEQKLVVVGDRGMVVFNDTLKENKLLYYREPIAWDGMKPMPDKQEPEVIQCVSVEPLKEECSAFIRAIEDRKQPLTNGEEGLRVLEVLSAAQRSLDNGGKWIDIKESEENSTYFTYPTAVIDEGCSIGTGTKIWHFSHVMADAIVGEGCNIGQNVVISPKVKLGKNVKIQNNVSVYTGVTCEDDVFLGPSMVFTNVKTPRSFVNRRDQYIPTTIRKGASIGANATIVCGVEIGEYALVGAGAVVTKNVPKHSVVYGNPAQITGWVCRCGSVIIDKTQSHLVCDICNTNLKLEHGN